MFTLVSSTRHDHPECRFVHESAVHTQPAKKIVPS